MNVLTPANRGYTLASMGLCLDLVTALEPTSVLVRDAVLAARESTFRAPAGARSVRGRWLASRGELHVGMGWTFAGTLAGSTRVSSSC